MRLSRVLAMASFTLAGAVMAQPDTAALERQVSDAEKAFARSMAERRFDDFARHVSDQAVFYGGSQVHRGKAAVLAAWKGFFEGEKAPFSWGPDRVDVLADGQLAFSSGLVRDPQGKVFSRFNSVWRLEPGGTWRVVFDKGSPLTEAERK